tara:strand:+ start:9843 stop:12323 length:2481 start_codon:yes stop_codon:yes gene_type:complete
MSLKVNKKSVKQMGGGQQESMMQPAQPQVDPAIQEISTFFASSMEEGQKAEDIIIRLMEQEVDQTMIAQALMQVGYIEEDVTSLFESVALINQKRKATAEQINNNPQQLARDQQDNQQGPVAVETIETEQQMMAKSGIEIKPENKGKFTRWAKARGMAVQEAANKVLSNKDKYPPSVVKMANFAKNAAGWKKEEGGEPDNEGFRALPDSVQNKIMKKARVGDEVAGNISSFVNDSNMNIVDTKGTRKDKDDIIYSTNKGSSDNSIKPNPLYFNPTALNSGGNFSIGNAANVLMEGYEDMFSTEKDEDGLAKGSFQNWMSKEDTLFDTNEDGSPKITSKSDRNKYLKYADADYNLEVDMSPKNAIAAKRYVDQFLVENPTADDKLDAVGNVVDAGLQESERLLEKIDSNPINDFFIKGSEGLKGIGKATWEGLQKTLNEKAAGGMTGIRQGATSQMSNLLLPEAQDGDEKEESIFKPFDITDFTISGVERPKDISFNALNDNNKNQGFGSNIQLLPGFNPDDPDFNMGEFLMSNYEGKSADELYGEINQPKLKTDFGGLEGFGERLFDSNVVQAFDDVSNFAYKGAGVINDFYEDRAIEDAKQDNRDSVVADNIYATEVDGFNVRGKNNVNTGLDGSEADRTTGLYMTKKGGENSYLANRDRVIKEAIAKQNKAEYGGEEGEAAYLANRDRVIKREMAKANDGKEYKDAFNNAGGDFNKKETKHIIQNMIDMYNFDSQNDTIISSGAPNPARGNSRKRALSNKMYDAGYKGDVDYNNIFDVIPNNPFTMDQVSFMSIPKNKEGGETVNVDAAMLAKLISAGADIEIL